MNLKDTLTQLDNQFSQGGSIKPSNINIAPISTGIANLDLALGVGGLPRGRIVEVFGAEATGKTTFALKMILELDKKNGNSIFFDIEHSFNIEYAQKIGIDLSKLLISQPETCEQTLEIIETLIKSNLVDLIIVDSVAALMPKSVDIDQNIGSLQAQLLSDGLRKIARIITKSNVCLVCINQIRNKMFSNITITPGGKALKFYAAIRIELKRIASIKSGYDTSGYRIKASIIKNKVASPFKEAEFVILHNEGIKER